MTKRFKKIYIEVTNICNLSCSFCPKTGRQLQRMNEDQFEQVLKKVKPYTDYIYLHLMGEPCAHPQLEEFLKLAKREGLIVNLTTNGTLLSKVKDVLFASGCIRQMNISLHSFEANTQGISLARYIEEIAVFIQEATEHGIICSLRLWNMDSHELRGSNALNGDILGLLQEKLAISEDLGERLMLKPSFKVRDKVYINMAEKFEWPDMGREPITTEAFCYGLRDQMGILVDGTVVPCCLDSEGNIPLGNIFETSLEDILESERAVALFEGFSNRKAVEPLCQRCGYVKRYKK
ncbi:MAG: radical SAM/SPASM domain-containing protein [Cellulosilyticaceae bacterium]